VIEFHLLRNELKFYCTVDTFSINRLIEFQGQRVCCQANGRASPL